MITVYLLTKSFFVIKYDLLKKTCILTKATKVFESKLILLTKKEIP